MLLRQIVGLSLCWLLLLGSLWDVAGPDHAHAANGHSEHASVSPAAVTGPVPQSKICHPSMRCIVVVSAPGPVLLPWSKSPKVSAIMLMFMPVSRTTVIGPWVGGSDLIIQTEGRRS